MNNGIIFFGGVAIGSVAGFFAGRKYMQEEAEKIINNEIQDYCDSLERYEEWLEKEYKEKARALQAEAKKANETSTDEPVTQTPYGAFDRSADSQRISTNMYEEAKKNYNLMGPKASYKEEMLVKEIKKYVEERDKKEKEEPVGEMEKPSTPFIITKDEYLFDKEQDKIVLLYYRLDDVLCDEEGDVIVLNDLSEVVGIKTIDKLKKEDRLYIRNHAYGIDYEIVALDQSYSEVYMLPTDVPPIKVSKEVDEWDDYETEN